MTPPANKSGKSSPVEGGNAKAAGSASEEEHFRATLEPDHTPLKWVIARVPFQANQRWPNLRRSRVRGTINGAPFRTSLFPVPGGTGATFILVNKAMQRSGGVQVGGTAEFMLAPDLEERPATLPADLIAAMRGERRLLRWTEALPEAVRRELGKSLDAVKGPEARQRRVEQMTERLLLAMEGERETPPVLAAMFSANPLAASGWAAMSEVQRRAHLLGIFYYQSPDARQGRAKKAFDDALARAHHLASPEDK